MKKYLTPFGVYLLCFLLSACAKNSLSERDSKREQIRSAAETKRRELQVVAGQYQGTLSQAAGSQQDVLLNLEIKDIPIVVDGQIDPVPTPTLTGFLKFNLSSNGSEFVGFSVEKADFDYKRNKFDVVFSNPEYKELVFSSSLEGQALSGFWSASTAAVSGTLKLRRLESEMIHNPFQLKGTYQGMLKNTHPQSNLPERLMVSLVTSQDIQSPNTVSVSGSIRFYLGAFGSSEYVEYPFSEVKYNIFTKQITAKVEKEVKLILRGELRENKIIGLLFADALGEVGQFEVTKQ